MLSSGGSVSLVCGAGSGAGGVGTALVGAAVGGGGLAGAGVGAGGVLASIESSCSIILATLSASLVSDKSFSG